MTDQTKKELIKSFAYGAGPEELAAIGRMTKEEANSFRNEHSAEIEKKRIQLQEEGWN